MQKKLPDSRVVKCFNIVPNPVMTHPVVGKEVPTMIIAGNNPAAKTQVIGILQEFGWPGRSTSAGSRTRAGSKRWFPCGCAWP